MFKTESKGVVQLRLRMADGTVVVEKFPILMFRVSTENHPDVIATGLKDAHGIATCRFVLYKLKSKISLAS